MNIISYDRLEERIIGPVSDSLRKSMLLISELKLVKCIVDEGSKEIKVVEVMFNTCAGHFPITKACSQLSENHRIVGCQDEPACY